MMHCGSHLFGKQEIFAHRLAQGTFLLGKTLDIQQRSINNEIMLDAQDTQRPYTPEVAVDLFTKAVLTPGSADQTKNLKAALAHYLQDEAFLNALEKGMGEDAIELLYSKARCAASLPNFSTAFADNENKARIFPCNDNQ